MQVRIEPQVGGRAVHHSHRSAASRVRLVASVELQDRLHGQVGEPSEQRAVLGEPPSPRAREAQDPLAQSALRGKHPLMRSAEVAFMRRPRQRRRRYDIPGMLRRRVVVETLRDRLQAYRRGGFDALLPRPPADRDVVRALEPHVADQLCSLKEQQPALSVSMLIQHARAQGVLGQDTPLAHATVHRLLVRHGLMDKLSTKPTSNDRCQCDPCATTRSWADLRVHQPMIACLIPDGLSSRPER